MASVNNWKITAAVLNGVQVINKIDETKFLLIVNRVIKSMLANADDAFTEEEKEKLQTSLELDSNGVHQLLSTVTHLMNQVIYYIVKPPVLRKHLVKKLLMEEERAAAFIQLWLTEAENLANALKHKSTLSHQVQDVNWNLNIAVKSGDKEQELEPRAEILLSLKNNENILLDFNREELSKFYCQLENIQAQLDSLQ